MRYKQNGGGSLLPWVLLAGAGVGAYYLYAKSKKKVEDTAKKATDILTSAEQEKKAVEDAVAKAAAKAAADAAAAAKAAAVKAQAALTPAGQVCSATEREAQADARLQLFSRDLLKVAPQDRSWTLSVEFTWAPNGSYTWKSKEYAGLDPTEVNDAVVKTIALLNKEGEKSGATFAICAGTDAIMRSAKTGLTVS